VDIILGGTPPDMPPGMDRAKHEISPAYKKWQEMHEKVIKAGGLHVIGTERHEARRVDNQLRGRSGRQGDPGSTRFYLSLEDDLMRIFGGEQIGGLMERLKLPEDQPIENPLISKAIQQAQVKVEGFNFDIRKNLVEFDDVANQQREIIYKLRRRVLESEDVKDEVLEKLGNQIERILLFAWPQDVTKPDPEIILVGLMDIIPFDETSKDRLKKELTKDRNKDELKEFLVKIILDVHVSREKQVGEKVMRQIEKYSYLGSIDHLWIDHIDKVDDLREGVRLRAYGQRDPLVEFKNEAYQMFEGLIDRIDEELSHRIFRIAVSTPRVEIPVERAQTNIDTKDMTGLSEERLSAVENKQSENIAQSNTKKLGRNDPCWCGKVDSNGKPVKWKKCHYPQLPS